MLCFGKLQGLDPWPHLVCIEGYGTRFDGLLVSVMTERRFPASAKKRRDAIRTGYVWRSRELVPALSLVALAMAIEPLATRVAALRDAMETRLGSLIAGPLDRSQAFLFSSDATALGLAWVAPILAIAVLAAALGSAIQPRRVGFGGRSPHRAASVEQGITVLKLFAVVAITTWLLRQELGGLVAWSLESTADVASRAGRLSLSWFRSIAAAHLSIALLDAFLQRQHWLHSLRMSQRELEDELRETEGDPAIRAAREQLAARLRASDERKAADAAR